MFNNSRFKLAREIRKFSKIELAEKMKLSVQTLTEWEKGSTTPKMENVYELSKILNFPIEFFTKDRHYTIDERTISFRAQTKMKASDRDKTHSYAKLATDLAYWLESKFNLPQYNIRIKPNETPKEAALRIRTEWGINDVCIDDTVFLLEKNGIKVFSLLDNIDYIDAFSFWDNDIPYVMLTNQKSAEHSRFDCAHELGHLTLHKNSEFKNRNNEIEANRFASEFLMPEETVQKYSNIEPTLNNFMYLKTIWKVSLAAIIRRFYELDYITEWTYRVLNIEMVKRGYKQKEPQGIEEYEESSVVNAIYKMLKEDDCSIQDISNETNIAIEDLNKLMFNKYSLSVFIGRGNKKDGTKANLKLLQ